MIISSDGIDNIKECTSKLKDVTAILQDVINDEPDILPRTSKELRRAIITCNSLTGSLNDQLPPF